MVRRKVVGSGAAICFVVVAGMLGQPPAGGDPAVPRMGGRGVGRGQSSRL